VAGVRVARGVTGFSPDAMDMFLRVAVIQARDCCDRCVEV
jgi:hypothetical protein